MQGILLHALQQITKEQEARLRWEEGQWSMDDFPYKTSYFDEFSQKFPQYKQLLEKLVEKNKNYAIESWIFANLYLYFATDPANSVIKVLENPCPANVAALILNAQMLDEQNREDNASLAAIGNEFLISAAALVLLLLKSLLAPIALLSAIMFYPCLGYNFNFLERYVDWLRDSVDDIEQAFCDFQSKVREFQQNEASKNALLFLGFFQEQASKTEPELIEPKCFEPRDIVEIMPSHF